MVLSSPEAGGYIFIARHACALSYSTFVCVCVCVCVCFKFAALKSSLYHKMDIQ